MTIWLCDRCGKQVQRATHGAGKYSIKKTIFDNDENGIPMKIQREVKFCDECSLEMEKFLDDEFNQIPTQVPVLVDRRK